MTIIELTTEIHAAIERVFDLARDLDLHAASMAHTGERAVAGRISGQVDAGDTVTWRARHFGLWWTLTSRITVVDPPVRFEDVQERGPFAWFRHEHRFEAIDGATRMHDRWEHRSPLGPLGRLVDNVVLGRYIRSLLVTRNKALKQAAEGALRVGAHETDFLVLYDADCGFCSRSARILRRLDRAGHLRLVPLQAAAEIVDGPPIDELLDSMHVRDRTGRWAVAGEAWIGIAREVPLLWPLAIAGRLPLIQRFVEWTYVQVAGNRHRIGRLLGDRAARCRREGSDSGVREDGLGLVGAPVCQARCEAVVR